MRIQYKVSYTAIICCVINLFSAKCYCSHVGGGQLYYKWLQDSTYQFMYKYYRACEAGTTTYSPIHISACNICDNSSYTIILADTIGVWNDDKVRICPAYGSSCVNPGNNTYPGMQECISYGVFTLPSRCDHWMFYYDDADRNAGLTNANGGGQGFYVCATLDNLHAQDNSSPELLTDF